MLCVSVHVCGVCVVCVCVWVCVCVCWCVFVCVCKYDLTSLFICFFGMYGVLTMVLIKSSALLLWINKQVLLMR